MLCLRAPSFFPRIWWILPKIVLIWNSGPNHVPDSGWPEIVKQPYTNSIIHASLFRCLVKTLNFIIAFSVEKNIG
jgi:hypothetical protein